MENKWKVLFQQILDRLKDKRYYIPISAVLVVTIVLLLVFLPKGGLIAPDGSGDDGLTPDPETYGQVGEGLNDNPTQNLDDLTQEERDRLIKPVVKYGGTLKSFVNNSATADLTFKIGDSETDEKTISMVAGAIVFDSKKGEVLLPSTLNDLKGQSMTLYVSGTEQTNNLNVDAVVLGDTQKILYTTLEKTELEEGNTVIYNAYLPSGFIISDKTEVLNALTNQPYAVSDLKIGDRLFVYKDSTEPIPVVNTGNTSENGKIEQENAILPVTEKQGVEKLYVYPSK